MSVGSCIFKSPQSTVFSGRSLSSAFPVTDDLEVIQGMSLGCVAQLVDCLSGTHKTLHPISSGHCGTPL